MKKIVVGDCFISPLTGIGVADGIDDPNLVIQFKQHRVLTPLLNPSYKSLPTLHLPISEPWFSRIMSGEKTEEYREKKTYNGQRLCLNWDSWIFAENDDLKFKPLKALHLTNGYGHHRPQLWAHIKEITIGRGNHEWGAPEHGVFIIKLGEVFHTKNLKVVN